MTLPDSTSSDHEASLYRQMLMIRRVEERILALHKEGRISGSVHVCVGQEIVPAIIVGLLDERDRVQATYRGHGWALACGVPPEALLSEVLGRATGTNGGRAGSPYLSSPTHRFIGENSIVGAGAPIANGIAMALAAQGHGGVSVVSIGDGATNQGSVHEAIVFAIARQLPVVFICENNSWSEMTPISDTVPNTSLSARAAGYGLPSRTVGGHDPAALAEAAANAINLARTGGGPSFLEVQVPRLLGHYNADIEHYRSDADKQEHRDRDPMTAIETQLASNNHIAPADLEAIQREVESAVRSAEEIALSAPMPDPSTAGHHVLAPLVSGAPVSALPVEGEELAFGLAVNRALTIEMTERPNLIAFGEDVALPGGIFGVTRNLFKRFGGDRVFDTPISESAILGAAVGSATEGLIPVVEIMWGDFLLVAFDQVVNQMANVRYISNGQRSAPIVVRMQQGITPWSCAQHSQSLEGLIAHIPGIKLGLPSTPHDAFTMLRAAIGDPDPVVIIEPRVLYLEKGVVDVDASVESAAGARVRRRGSDVAIITWGRMVDICMAAAVQLEESGVSATVLDLRWLNPLDESAIIDAVTANRGRIVVAHEANVTGGFGAEISARIVERCFPVLQAPIARIGLPDVRVPAAPSLQAAVFPDARKVFNAAIKTARYVDEDHLAPQTSATRSAAG